MSVPWKEGRQMVSNEEKDLRWEYYKGRFKGTLAEFNKQITEIRERTGKP